MWYVRIQLNLSILGMLEYYVTTCFFSLKVLRVLLYMILFSPFLFTNVTDCCELNLVTCLQMVRRLLSLYILHEAIAHIF